MSVLFYLCNVVLFLSVAIYVVFVKISLDKLEVIFFEILKNKRMTKKEYENVMSQMSFPFRSVIVFKLPKLTNTDEKYIFAKKKIEMVSRVLMSVFFLTFTVIFVLLYFYPFLGKSGE